MSRPSKHYSTLTQRRMALTVNITMLPLLIMMIMIMTTISNHCYSIAMHQNVQPMAKHFANKSTNIPHSTSINWWTSVAYEKCYTMTLLPINQLNWHRALVNQRSMMNWPYVDRERPLFIHEWHSPLTIIGAILSIRNCIHRACMWCYAYPMNIAILVNFWSMAMCHYASNDMTNVCCLASIVMVGHGKRISICHRIVNVFWNTVDVFSGKCSSQPGDYEQIVRYIFVKC